MSNLNHDEIRKREELKKVLDSELFGEALYDVRRNLGEEMLRTNDSTARDFLHAESQALQRIHNKLTEFANEVLFLEQKKDEAA